MVTVWGCGCLLALMAVVCPMGVAAETPPLTMDVLKEALGAAKGGQVQRAVTLLDGAGAAEDTPVELVALKMSLLGKFLQQLGRPAQATQRILDLVRQIAYQGPGRMMLGQEMFFPIDPQPPVHLTQLQQQFRRGVALQQRRGGAIHGDLASGRQNQL